MSIIDELLSARDDIEVPLIFTVNGRSWRKWGAACREAGVIYVLAVPLAEWEAQHSPAAGAQGILLPRIVVLPEGWPDKGQ